MSAPMWKMRTRGVSVPADELEAQCENAYEFNRNLFTIRIHHGGAFMRFPNREYVGGTEDIFDMVDIDVFSVFDLDEMVLKLGYTGRYKLIEVYIEHGCSRVTGKTRVVIEELGSSPLRASKETKLPQLLPLTWPDNTDSVPLPGNSSQGTPFTQLTLSECGQNENNELPLIDSQFGSFNLSFTPVVPATASKEIVAKKLADIVRMMEFEENELDVPLSYSYLDAMNFDSTSGLSPDELFGVGDLDLNVGLPVLGLDDPQTHSGEGQQDTRQEALEGEVQHGNGVGPLEDEEDDIHNVNDSDYEGGLSDNAGSGDEGEAAVMNDEGHTGVEPPVQLNGFHLARDNPSVSIDNSSGDQVNRFRLTGNKAYDSIGNSSLVGEVVGGVEPVCVEGFQSHSGSDGEPDSGVRK